MTVVKMKKTISRPRKKATRRSNRRILMTSLKRPSIWNILRGILLQHIEDFGMDFLASEWAKFNEAQGEFSQSSPGCKQEKVGNKWAEGRDAPAFL